MKTTIFKIFENSQFAKFAKFRMKNHFFLGKLYQQLFCFTLSLHWWYSIPSLVWFGQLLDPMKTTIFKIFENSQFAKFAKFRMKTHFFVLGELYQQFFGFTLSLHWWYSIPSLVWFGQLLDPMKKNIFKILENSQFAEFAKFRMKNHFFLDKLYQQLFCFTLSRHWWYWWYSIPSLVWFGQLLDPMKTTIFKILENSRFAKFAKFRMKTHFFVLGKLYQQLLALHCHYTGDILKSEFGLIWATPWADEKQLFLKFSKFRNSRNSQNSVWKPIFFLGKLYQQLFGFTLSLHWWYSIQRLVWFGQLLDPTKKNFFKILKNLQFAKFAKFRMKTQVLPRHALQFFFALHSHYTDDTPYRVWFNFGQLLNPMKKNYFWNSQKFAIPKFAKFRMKTFFFPRQAIPITFWLYTVITLLILNTEFGLIWTTPWPHEKNLFLKFLFREIQKVLYENPTFFLVKLNKKYFLLYTVITLVILNTEFGLIWTTPWPHEKNLFLKFLFREIQKVLYENPTFFLGKLYQKYFLLYNLTILVILNTEFGLIWANPWPDEKDLFLKFLFREILKVLYENPTFFLGKLYQKYFLLYNLTILVILNTEFGLIWTTPWPDAKELFLKFSKIRNSRKSQNSVWKPKFFLGTLYHFFALHWWYSIPRLVWFGQLLNRWKKPIFKTSFSRNSKSSVWKPNLFPNQAKPKILFALYSHYTGDTPYRVWFDLDNSLTRWKNLFLKVLFREIQKVLYENPTFFLRKLNQKHFLLYTVITVGILHTAFGLIWTTP